MNARTRRPDWPERLDALLHKWQALPFVWGQTDCACFAAAIVRELTGHETQVGWGAYSGPATARQRLAAHGFANLTAAVSRELGPARPPLHLQRGDIVMVSNGLGVLLGSKAAVRGPQHGLLFVRSQLASHGWPV